MNEVYPHRYVVKTPSGETWTGRMRCPCGKGCVPPPTALVGATLVEGDNCPDALRQAIRFERAIKESIPPRAVIDAHELVVQAEALGASAERDRIVAWLRRMNLDHHTFAAADIERGAHLLHQD